MNYEFLVDTDVMIDFLRGFEPAVEFIVENSPRIALSAVTIAELHSGVRRGREETVLAGLSALLPVLPVTVEIAKQGGLYRRDHGKSSGVGLADAMIAATADCEHLILYTLNVKHFPMLEKVERPYLKS